MMPLKPRRDDDEGRSAADAAYRRVAFSLAEIREFEGWISTSPVRDLRGHAQRLEAMRRLHCVPGPVQDRLERLLAVRSEELGVTIEHAAPDTLQMHSAPTDPLKGETV